MLKGGIERVIQLKYTLPIEDRKENTITKEKFTGIVNVRTKENGKVIKTTEEITIPIKIIDWEYHEFFLYKTMQEEIYGNRGGTVVNIDPTEKKNYYKFVVEEKEERKKVTSLKYEVIDINGKKKYNQNGLQ